MKLKLVGLVMNTLARFGIFALFFATVLGAEQQPFLSKTELKQQVLSICMDTLVTKNGNDSIVAARKQLAWKRINNNLDWNGDLSAEVRMVVRTDGNQLSRVLCNVDQRTNVVVTTLETKDRISQELIAIKQ